MKSIFTQFYIQYYRTNILQEVNALAFEFRIVLGQEEEVNEACDFVQPAAA